MKESSKIACEVSRIGVEERERIIRNSKELFLSVQEVKELPDGYALGFKDCSPQMISRIAEFISFDRQCCSFLHHELAVEPNGGLSWIRIRGGEGAKAKIKAALSNLLPPEKAIK